MRVIEPRGDVDSHVHLRPRLMDCSVIRDRHCKISAKAQIDAAASGQQRFKKSVRVVAVLPGRFERKHFSLFLHWCQRDLFGDADGALALHVGVAPDGWPELHKSGSAAIQNSVNVRKPEHSI
jgi:hypothetical protein